METKDDEFGPLILDVNNGGEHQPPLSLSQLRNDTRPHHDTAHPADLPISAGDSSPRRTR